MTGPREIYEAVEIDVPFCQNTFGTAPCTAALGPSVLAKCWNLRKNCADPANYAEGTPLTLSFTKVGSPIPKGQFSFPALERASATSATVNIAGSAPDMGALGRRATLDVTLRDFTYDDVRIDPYQSQRISGAALYSGVGYNPKDNGTFLARIKARFPYYAGKTIRLIRGYLENGALVDVQTRTFQIKEWTGPDDNGSHRIAGIDVLDLANERTALAPKPSSGLLTLDITAGQTSFTVTPTGAGAGYAASGRLCIGSEIMGFTRASDTFTVTRGIRNTTAATHSQGDTVQETLSYDLARLDDVASDLILNFTGTSSTWLDAGQLAIWAAEVTRWGLSVKLTTDITTPTPVATLLAELGDLGCTVWPDLEAGKMQLQMNRPLDGEVARDVDDKTIISLDQEDRDDDRLTQVLFYGKRFDPTKSLTDDSNYGIKILTADPTSYTLYGGVKSRKIYTRWLDQGDQTTMLIASTRLLRRLLSAPKRITVKLDEKDSDIKLVDVLNLQSDLVSGSDGVSVPTLFQVIGRSEPVPNVNVEVTLQSYNFAGRNPYIAPPGTPDYNTATAAEREAFSFISAPSAPYFPDNSEPYRII